MKLGRVENGTSWRAAANGLHHPAVVWFLACQPAVACAPPAARQPHDTAVVTAGDIGGFNTLIQMAPPAWAPRFLPWACTGLPRRQCLQCGASTLAQGQHWYRHPVTGEEWVYGPCCQRIKRAASRQKLPLSASSGAPRSRPPKGGPLSRQRLLLLCQLKSASRAAAAAEAAAAAAAEAAREPPKEHCLPGSPWQCPRRQRLLAQLFSSSRSASRSRSPRRSSRLRSSRTCLACCWVLRSRLLPPPLG